MRGCSSGDGVRESRETVPTRCSPHSTINVRLDVSKIAGPEKSGGDHFSFTTLFKYVGEEVAK